MAVGVDIVGAEGAVSVEVGVDLVGAEGAVSSEVMGANVGE